MNVNVIEFADLVEREAQQRGDPVVPRQYIDEALQQIEEGVIFHLELPSNTPLTQSMYHIARYLEQEAIEQEMLKRN